MTKRQRNAVDELTRVAEWLCDGTRYVLESVVPKRDDDGGYYEMTFLDALAGEYMLINLPDIQPIDDSIAVLVMGWEQAVGAPPNQVAVVDVKLGHGPN